MQTYNCVKSHWTPFALVLGSHINNSGHWILVENKNTSGSSLKVSSYTTRNPALYKANVFSSSLILPTTSQGFTTWLVRFLHMWQFFNPIIEVVTFCLHGWNMLGVLLLPAFTCFGHECQDLLSPYNWNNGVRTILNSKGKIPSTDGFEKGGTCDAASCRIVSSTLPTEHFWPLKAMFLFD